jgi:hypothetical protein
MSRVSRGYHTLVVAGVVASVLCFSLPVRGAELFQPAPSRPGDPAPESEALYRAGQSQAGSTDVDRIKAAIQVYFDLKAQSLVRGRALDPGFVIDRSSKTGEDLYNYELGLLQYCLTLWEYDRLAFIRWEYTPTFEAIQVTGETATARILLRGVWGYADTPSLESGEDEHTLELRKTADGWKLVEDTYSNEITDTYPRGTDFAARELVYRRRIAAGIYSDTSAAPSDPQRKAVLPTAYLWLALAVFAAVGLALVRTRLARRR